MLKKLLFLFLLFMGYLPLVAQQDNYFANPVIKGDVADPSIIRYNGQYYATGTSSEWAPHYPIFQSDDLVNWKQVGHVFEEKPEWIKNSFWAPEWYVHQNKVYVYYTARKKADNISCIGVAVANHPSGPFKDYGPIVEFGKEAIDAFVLQDKGNLYISWKAYGLDNRPIELLACKLSKDGLKLEGEPFSLLRDDEHQGLEGQHWYKEGDYYYLIYSIKGCCGPSSDYAVSVARSKKLRGPYEKYAGNPILHGSKEVLSIGHGTLTKTPDGRNYYLCHAYLQGSGFYQGRQPFLMEMKMREDKWPHFVTGEYATVTQPMPNKKNIQKPVADFYDDFTDNKLRKEWTWNYPYVNVKATPSNGILSLSGTPIEKTTTGSALCLRPTASNYVFETAVINEGKEWKGVVLYGDHENLITLGCKANKLAIKQLIKGKEEVLAELPMRAPVAYLRLHVTEGVNCAFSWSLDGKEWNAVSINGLQKVNMKPLVRWDRVSRPGLYQEGVNEVAQFAYGRMFNP